MPLLTLRLTLLFLLVLVAVAAVQAQPQSFRKHSSKQPVAADRGSHRRQPPAASPRTGSLTAAAQTSKRRQRYLNRRTRTVKNAAQTGYGAASPYTLDMDCAGMSESDCLNYMQNYLYDYIEVNRSYNRMNIPSANPYNNLDPPSPGDVYDTIDATVLITFVDLLDVDIISGTMTCSIFMDIDWVDMLLSWNNSKTQGMDELIVPMDLIWMPDIIHYNAVGGVRASFDIQSLYLYGDGSVWYSAKAVMVTSCEYKLSAFPFDTQTCRPQYGSWNYPTYQLNITTVEYDVDSTSFGNLAWNVDAVSVSRDVEYLWEVYEFSFANYMIQITRYSDHYVSATILPATIVTTIVLSGLYISNVHSRLSLAVTGLLTIIAVQWSISNYLPVAKGTNWLATYLQVCMLYIALVCLQCYISGYMMSQKYDDSAPRWVKYLIHLSNLHNVLWKRYGSHSSASDGAGSSNSFEMSSTVNKLADDSAQSVDETTPASASAAAAKSTGAGVGVPKGSSEGDAAQEAEFGWKRGSRAFDRIMRVWIPLSYLITIIAFFLNE